MNPQESDRKRYSRYQRVVRAAAATHEFELGEVQSLCAEEKPALVTRIVHMLVGDGLLQPCETSSRRYRWSSQRESFDPESWIRSKIYTNGIKRGPVEDRPRERLLQGSPAEMKTAELLAILIRTGRANESALQAGEKVAAEYGGQLHTLAEASRGELRGISSAVTDVAWCQIAAGIELGRRVEQARRAYREDDRPVIRSTADAVQYCQRNFARLAEDGAREEFWVVCLDTKLRVAAFRQVSIGTLNQSLVGPREVYRVAVKENAAAVILLHNHPSGDPTPSREDLAVTERMEKVGQTLGIQMLDHVIVARRDCLSIQEYRQRS